MYESWFNAKYGDSSRRGYAKLHILAVYNGVIVQFEVTKYTPADSSVFRKMLAHLSTGSGIVDLDVAYDSKLNYIMIVVQWSCSRDVCPKER